MIGDSLELARKARECEGDVIAFCGVWFMAETAKVLNPGRIVVVPDREASCSLVETCPVEPVREFRRSNPDHVIVSYINTSIEVKAESDILCTSRNAVKVVNSIPAERPILFLPDLQPGRITCAGRPAAENMRDLAGGLHRARHLSRRAGGGGAAGASGSRGGGASGVPGSRAGHGGFRRLDLGPGGILRPQPRRASSSS